MTRQHKIIMFLLLLLAFLAALSTLTPRAVRAADNQIVPAPEFYDSMFIRVSEDAAKIIDFNLIYSTSQVALDELMSNAPEDISRDEIAAHITDIFSVNGWQISGAYNSESESVVLIFRKRVYPPAQETGNS